MPVTVQRSGPGFAQVKRDMERIRKSDVLVGVPAANAQRKDEPITNASLMFIHSKGSPIRGIPARPTIEPAIQQSQALISPQLARASQYLMQNKPREAEKALARAGTVAVNATKRMFGSAQLAPNAPSTIKRKGSDKPLINTAALRRAQTYVVCVSGSTPVTAQTTE